MHIRLLKRARNKTRGSLHQVWVHVVESQDEVEPYLDAIIDCYKTVFSAKPYKEKFSRKKVETGIKPSFRKFARRGVLLVLMTGKTRARSRVIGFGACEGAHVCEAAAFLRGNQHRLDAPLENYLYMAELGVLSEFRQQGFGLTLVRMRIKEAASRNGNRFTHLIMRTAREGSHSAGLYEKLGCSVIPNLIQRKVGNKTKSKERIFLSMPIARR